MEIGNLFLFYLFSYIFIIYLKYLLTWRRKTYEKKYFLLFNLYIERRNLVGFFNEHLVFIQAKMII